MINVVDNLHKQIQRKDVQKFLEALVTSGDARMKEYGKNQIFWREQSGMQSQPLSELNAMDQQVRGYRRVLAAYQARRRCAVPYPYP